MPNPNDAGAPRPNQAGQLPEPPQAPASPYGAPPAPGYDVPPSPAAGYGGQPSYPDQPGAQAYDHPGGYPQSAGGPPRTGGIAWGLGFLGYIPIPLVGMLVTVGVMVGVGLSQRKYGGLAAENGRNAANWALTWLLVMIVAVALVILSLGLSSDPDSPHPLAVVAGLLLIAAGITHLVTIIVGLVKAGRGQAHRGPAIPFFRGTGS